MEGTESPSEFSLKKKLLEASWRRTSTANSTLALFEASQVNSPTEERKTTFDESYIGFKTIGITFFIILLIFCFFLTAYCYRKCLKAKTRVAPEEEEAALPTERTLLPSERSGGAAPSSLRGTDSRPASACSANQRQENELERARERDREQQEAKYSKAKARLKAIHDEERRLRKVATQKKERDLNPIARNENHQVARVSTFVEKQPAGSLVHRPDATSFIITEQLQQLKPRRRVEPAVASQSILNRSSSRQSKQSPRQVGASLRDSLSADSDIKAATSKNRPSLGSQEEAGARRKLRVRPILRRQPTIAVSCDSDPSPQKVAPADVDHLSVFSANNLASQAEQKHEDLKGRHVQFTLPDRDDPGQVRSPRRTPPQEENQTRSLSKTTKLGRSSSSIRPETAARRKALVLSNY